MGSMLPYIAYMDPMGYIICVDYQYIDNDVTHRKNMEFWSFLSMNVAKYQPIKTLMNQAKFYQG